MWSSRQIVLHSTNFVFSSPTAPLLPSLSQPDFVVGSGGLNRGKVASHSRLSFRRYLLYSALQNTTYYNFIDMSETRGDQSITTITICD